MKGRTLKWIAYGMVLLATVDVLLVLPAFTLAKPADVAVESGRDKLLFRLSIRDAFGVPCWIPPLVLLAGAAAVSAWNRKERCTVEGTKCLRK